MLTVRELLASTTMIVFRFCTVMQIHCDTTPPHSILGHASIAGCRQCIPVSNRDNDL